MSCLDYYALGISIFGFLLFVFNRWLYTHTQKGQIDIVLTIVAFLGGSIGMLPAILLFNRECKPEKRRLFSRVYVFSLSVIHILGFLMLKGVHKPVISFAVWEPFARYPILGFYLLLVNIVTFFVYMADKKSAEKHDSRISIFTLLSLAFIGGSVGAISSMYTFRHKTQKPYFYIGVPLIMGMQIFVLFFVQNMT